MEIHSFKSFQNSGIHWFESLYWEWIPLFWAWISTPKRSDPNIWLIKEWISTPALFRELTEQLNITRIYESAGNVVYGRKSENKNITGNNQHFKKLYSLKKNHSIHPTFTPWVVTSVITSFGVNIEWTGRDFTR